MKTIAIIMLSLAIGFGLGYTYKGYNSTKDDKVAEKPKTIIDLDYKPAGRIDLGDFKTLLFKDSDGVFDSGYWMKADSQEGVILIVEAKSADRFRRENETFEEQKSWVYLNTTK